MGLAEESLIQPWDSNTIKIRLRSRVRLGIHNLKKKDRCLLGERMKLPKQRGLLLSLFVFLCLFLGLPQIFNFPLGIQKAQADGPAFEPLIFNSAASGTSINGNKPSGTVERDLLITIKVTDGGREEIDRSCWLGIDYGQYRLTAKN